MLMVIIVEKSNEKKKIGLGKMVMTMEIIDNITNERENQEKKEGGVFFFNLTIRSSQRNDHDHDFKRDLIHP